MVQESLQAEWYDFILGVWQAVDRNQYDQGLPVKSMHLCKVLLL